MAAKPSKQFQCPVHWTLAQRLDHYTDKSGGPDACWPWTGGRVRGYGYLYWKGKTRRVSRLAWENANGPIPAGMWVLHKCDNPPCRNEAHLWLGTNSANVADRDAKGRTPRGGAHSRSRAKLTAEEVREIRAATGTHHSIAKRLGVSRVAVTDIKRGDTWKHVI